MGRNYKKGAQISAAIEAYAQKIGASKRGLADFSVAARQPDK
jgi:hypothetical protein